MPVKDTTIKQHNRRIFLGNGELIDWPMPNELMGIELEAEGVYIADNSVLAFAGWRTEIDGSLRRDGREFVLAAPLSGSALTRAIHTLYAARTQSIVNFQTSPRAGTHVHINWQDNTVASAASLIALMYCIEPLVYAWADEDRAWCSYCNPLSDIGSTVMASLLNLDEYTDDMWLMSEVADGRVGRYFGLNFAALSKYGTMEFRYFPSTTSAADMVKWVKFVQLAKLAAIKWADNLPGLVERLSAGNIVGFLAEHFDCDGIAEELLTAVNNPDAAVGDKALELASVLDMRVVFEEVYDQNPAALAYIGSVSGVPQEAEEYDGQERPQRASVADPTQQWFISSPSSGEYIRPVRIDYQYSPVPEGRDHPVNPEYLDTIGVSPAHTMETLRQSVESLGLNFDDFMRMTTPLTPSTAAAVEEPTPDIGEF